MSADSKLQVRTRVKICGITRMQDAAVAVSCGVDALGFIFYARSPRYISLASAAEIIERLPPFVDRVGVFVDALIDDLDEYAKIGLTCLQLHGTESVEYCREVRLRLPFCKIIKALRVESDSRATLFSPYNSSVDAFLLDTYSKGEKGGTGRAFDWSIIPKLRLQKPFILAGGLSLDNVVRAVSEVRPYGVDINSGVEDLPGEKSHRLIREIFGALAAVR